MKSARIGLLALAIVVSGSASSAILWDQYTVPNTANNIVDQEFSDFPTFSTYVVGDVTVGGGGWNITRIGTLSTVNTAWITGVTQGRINIFAKTGTLPTAADDPTTGTLVGVTVSQLDASTMEIAANGLNINLAPGNYWVGLTPLAAFGTLGQAFHYHTTVVGDPGAVRNPGNGFALGSAWGNFSIFSQPANDGTLRIEGTVVPEPGTIAALSLGALALLRRRRRN